MSSTLAETALKYHRLGWTVLPIRFQSKIPHVKWKKYRQEKPTEADIRAWFKKWKDAGVGIITGKASGVYTLDFDSPDAIGAFESNICDLPETIRMSTGRDGGFQLFLRYPNDYEIRNAAGILKDLDIRAEGGLTIIPPSVHKSGRKYQWGKVDPLTDGLDDLLGTPEELIDFLKGHDSSPIRSKSKPTKAKQNGTSNNKPGWVSEVLMGVSQGSRNQTCAKLAGYYIRIFEGDAQQALSVLEGWNARNTPPLPQSEIEKTLASISERHGTLALGDFLKQDIYDIQKLIYPDGCTKYNIFLEGQHVPVTVSPEELANPNQFRIKLMTQTDNLMATIKNARWYGLLNSTLPEATVVLMNEDETYIAAIKETILQDVTSRNGTLIDFEEPEILIERQAVVVDRSVFVKLQYLCNALAFNRVKISLKELASLLRRMNFKPYNGRLGKVVARTWTIPFKDLI